MLQIELITLFPEMLTALQSGITGRAQTNRLLQINAVNPRDFTHNKSGRVDDRPFGGGPGMVMQCQPLEGALAAAKTNTSRNTPVIALSPQGIPLTQARAATLSKAPSLILLAGRYEGIDERFISTYVDEEISIGDFVVSGGELPAMLLIDALTRLLPGALGDAQSAACDSFSHGLLDHPHYTRPEYHHNQGVPSVLLSGDHAAIERYRLQQSLGKTWQKRPDLLKRRTLSKKEQVLLDEFKRNNPAE